LDEFEGLDVVEALIDALFDPVVEVREAAAQTLSENKNEDAAPMIMERLKSVEDPFIKAALLRALRPLRQADSQTIALEALQDSDAKVRREAVGVLAYLKSDNVLLALMDVARNDIDEEARRTAMGSLVYSKSDKSVETLMSGLKDGNWRVREEAAMVLGKVGVTSALDSLIDAMDDEYWQVRVKAAASLGQLKDPQAIPVLGQALSYSISNLRKEAASALGQIAHPDALPFLEKAKEDVDPDVRKIALWAIQQIN
jgi:HEAT repeat protein